MFETIVAVVWTSGHNHVDEPKNNYVYQSQHFADVLYQDYVGIERDRTKNFREMLAKIKAKQNSHGFDHVNVQIVSILNVDVVWYVTDI